MLTSRVIADFLNSELYGANILITSFADLTQIKDNTLIFVKKYSEDTVKLLQASKNFLSIVPRKYHNRINCSYIISENPRLDFIKILAKFFYKENENKGKIHNTAVIEEGAMLGTNITIGANSYISRFVTIGDNTIIHPNVVIDNIVIIGRNCEIKSGAVIGQTGFGFERDVKGVPIYFPHFGEIKIGDNVFIGSNSTIERATLGLTIIEDNVKIDDLVQIGHNSIIGKNTIITVGTVISGGVIIENDCYIAPNVSIREKIIIRKNAFVGIGAVVVKNVSANTIVAGNPAKELKK